MMYLNFLFSDAIAYSDALIRNAQPVMEVNLPDLISLANAG